MDEQNLYLKVLAVAMLSINVGLKLLGIEAKKNNKKGREKISTFFSLLYWFELKILKSI